MLGDVENELFTRTHAASTYEIIMMMMIIIIQTHRARSAGMRHAAGWGELSNRKGRGRRKFENLIPAGAARRPRCGYRNATHTQ